MSIDVMSNAISHGCMFNQIQSHECLESYFDSVDVANTAHKELWHKQLWIPFHNGTIRLTKWFSRHTSTVCECNKYYLLSRSKHTTRNATMCGRWCVAYQKMCFSTIGKNTINILTWSRQFWTIIQSVVVIIIIIMVMVISMCNLSWEHIAPSYENCMNTKNEIQLNE